MRFFSFHYFPISSCCLFFFTYRSHSRKHFLENWFCGVAQVAPGQPHTASLDLSLLNEGRLWECCSLNKSCWGAGVCTVGFLAALGTCSLCQRRGRQLWTHLLGHSSKGSVRFPVTTHKSLWMGNDAGWRSREAWEKCGPWHLAGRPPTKTAQLGHYKWDPTLTLL